MTIQRYIAPLNALRAVASIWVVFYHFRYFSSYPWFDIPGVSRGYLGVDFFFILSGLIISHVYLEKSRHAFGLNGYLRFLGYRLARIWPVHAVFMVLMLLAALATGAVLTDQQIVDWISLTFLARQWLLPDSYAWNSSAWSVSAELFAYAFIFPLVVVLARRLSWLAAASILIVAGLGLFAGMEWRAGTFNIIPFGGPLIRVTAGFSLGAGVYCLLLSMNPAKIWDVAIWIGMMSIPIALQFQSDLVFLVVILALLVGAYMSLGLLGRLLASRPFFLMGEWSFGLYLAHIPVLITTQFVADQFGIERGFLFGIGSLFISVGVAATFYYLIEQPARIYARHGITRLSQLNSRHRSEQQT